MESPRWRLGSKGDLRVLSAIAMVVVVLATAGGAGARSPLSPRAAGASDFPCDVVANLSVHVQIIASLCEPGVEAIWAQNLSQPAPPVWNVSTTFNFSFSLMALYEIAPNGSIVRNAVPFETRSAGPRGSGEWSPATGTLTVTTVTNESAPPGGPVAVRNGSLQNYTYPQSGTNVANVTTTLQFHLVASPMSIDTPTNLTGTSGGGNASGNATGPATALDTVKFDMELSNWSWASPADHLAALIVSTGSYDSHFEWQPGTQNLSLVWNSTGSIDANLVFGSTASAGTPGLPSEPVRVTTQEETVGPMCYPCEEYLAYVLVTFQGPPGTYENLTYDPWIEFGSGPAGLSGSLQGAFSGPELVFVGAGVSAVVGGMAVIAIRRRRDAPELGLVRPPATPIQGP
jgi:hypothetical protein